MGFTLQRKNLLLEKQILSFSFFISEGKRKGKAVELFHLNINSPLYWLLQLEIITVADLLLFVCKYRSLL